MKINKIAFILCAILILLSISAVSASDIAADDDGIAADVSNDNLSSLDDVNAIYVDINGKSSNDGSQDSPINTISKAVSKAKDNDTIYIASGEYKGISNSRITIDKSLTFIGSDNTIINGQKSNYIFDIVDGVSVTFKNIQFVNSYKAPESYSSSFNSNVYGASLDIKKATVVVDNCKFISNVLSYGDRDNYIYGGAISNFGNLTIINSIFQNNTALSTSGLYSYGGSVYNNGKLSIYNSSFIESRSVDFGNGAAIANDGELLMEDSIVSQSRSLHECKGTAIYNTGDFKLINSVVENNYIERASFNCIFGAIYNSGTLTARGSIFRNNTGDYESPIPSYKGSPNIYNSGTLNLTYNFFIDNTNFDGISSDIFFNGGEIISLDNNWWNTNENPYQTGSKINVDKINTWLMVDITPVYSKLNISDSVILKASWTNSINSLSQINSMPASNITFETAVGGKKISETKQFTNGSCEFIFDYAQNKGSYDVVARMGSFNQSAVVDVGKELSYVEFSVNDNITYLNALSVNVEVLGGASVPKGVVLVKIADDVYTIDLVNGKGKCEISDLVPNKYVLDIAYEGSDVYFKSFNKTTVTVKKQDVSLNLSIPEIKVGQKGSAIVSLAPNGVQGQAVLYVDGVRKKIVYLYNGDTTISLSNFAEGEYNITLEFVETQYYNPAVVSGILRVTRYDSAINISAEDIGVGENATVTIRVSPESLRGEATLIINGVNETIFIDNAVTNITISDLNAGQYNITLLFNGDLRYNPVNVSTSFKVLKTPVVLDVTIYQDEKNLNGTVTVKTNNINCTGVVGVYVNYNTYKMNLTNGMAKFNVKYDKGTNYIFVFYQGDRFFEDATWNTTIGVADQFVFMGQNSTGFEGNDFNYSIRLIEINGIPMPNRVVSVDFNGIIYDVTTDDDGYAYLKLNLASGNYNISASYKNATIYNYLTVRPIDFNLTSLNVTYGSDEIIRATFEDGVLGKVNFIIGDISVFSQIINGTALYNASGLKVGDYTVKAIYSNDLVQLTKTNGFSVEKANLILNVRAADATPDIDEIIDVSDLKDATGDITFIFNGTEYDVPIKDSHALLNLSRLNEGSYSLAVKYVGDNNYLPANETVSFYIKEFASDIILSINDDFYGNDLLATAILNSNATGIVRFNVGNITKDIAIVGGKAVWNFTGINVGTYNLTAEYLGNSYYISSSNSTSFAVFKANSTIELYVKEVCLNENIRIYADLSPNATGSVSFSMVGYFSPRNKPVRDSSSNWYIAPLNTGEYLVIAKYLGDDNYYASNTTFILNVSQRKSVLKVELNDARISERVNCKVSLYTSDGDPITSKVTLKIGSSSYDINVKEGSGSLVIGRMAEGNYAYSVEYAGDENFTSASVDGRFKVVDDLLDVNLSASNLTKYYGGSGKLQITLKDSNNNPFANQEIIVRIKSNVYTVFTDSKGEASLDVSLAPGEYVANITFCQTERYHEASVNATVTVLTTVEGIDVVKLYGSDTPYYAVFTDSNGKALGNINVTFKIGSKSFTVTTLPNGIARVNININAGTYTISSVNPVTGQKLSNTLTIYNKIMENKDVSNYYGAKTTYKVRIYADGGKAVGAGKVVTFKVNGKTYKVKTDSNGYAKLAIKLNPKTYTVTASYGGFKVSNKITVKNVLSAKDISKKKSKTTKFSAKLVDSSGKVLKGKKITFKVNGKTYSAKTNSKGIASVNLSLKVGKYKIQSIYGKSKITNTITIKK